MENFLQKNRPPRISCEVDPELHAAFSMAFSGHGEKKIVLTYFTQVALHLSESNDIGEYLITILAKTKPENMADLIVEGIKRKTNEST